MFDIDLLGKLISLHSSSLLSLDPKSRACLTAPLTNRSHHREAGGGEVGRSRERALLDGHRERGDKRESVFPTMVLLGLGTTWGCTQWLHREDYTVFELGDNPDGKDERGSGKMEEASVARASEEPSQYWLIEFKDRRLEREYLEDLLDVSSSCFFVGSALALLLYLALPLAFAIGVYIYLSTIEVFRDPETVPVNYCGRTWVLGRVHSLLCALDGEVEGSKGCHSLRDRGWVPPVHGRTHVHATRWSRWRKRYDDFSCGSHFVALLTLFLRHNRLV